MVPPEYLTYFDTMASVAATLFGLIFLVISISPENTTAQNAPLERQVKATAAYLALSNPLIISLFALLPHQHIGPAVIGVAAGGLLQMAGMAAQLLRHPGDRSFLPRNGAFILGGLILYGLQFQDGLTLLRVPGDGSVMYRLGTLLIFILVYGVARAWELMGGRQFHIRNLLATILARRPAEPPAPKDEGDGRKAGG